VANAKRLVEYVSTHNAHDNLLYTVGALADAWESEELREGIEAFFQKRKPKWQG
jgi:methylglutaconyl-CoA hydratase